MPCLIGALAALALGCGEDEPALVIEPDAICSPGEWRRADGSCVPAGLPPDMPCPPAEWLRDDGVCIPAGVPADGCGEGFLHDGDRGCEPILPEEPCPAGFMAAPGETMCREVAPCVPGTWGNIPVEPDTEYVDAAYLGIDSDGSALKPWTSIQAAVDAAASGAIIAIAAGSYLEDVRVSGKPVRLWGVCPALVEVVGSGGEYAAVLALTGATGTEVRSLAMRGDAWGFGASGARDVLLERVWVHDNASRGINVDYTYGPTSFTLRASLVEQNRRLGVFVGASEGTVEASVVRDTQPDALGLGGRGVSAEAAQTGAPSNLLLRTSLVERNHDAGVYVSGSEATVEASVVRDTQMNNGGSAGHGVSVRANATSGAASTLLLRTSLVEQNHEAGVFVAGSQATAEQSVLRTTQPNARGLFGRGLSVQTDPMAAAPATATLRASLVHQSHDVGVFSSGAEMTVERSVVRDTQPDALGRYGRGVEAQSDTTTGVPSNLMLHASLVEQSHSAGLLVFGSNATVEASVVRDTRPSAGDGRGVNAQVDTTTGAASMLVLRTSLVEQSNRAGVSVFGSVATIESCLVRDTVASASGSWGEGVVVSSYSAPANGTITGTRIERSARAAIASWGAHVAIGGSVLSCQAFDIDSETFLGNAASLDDLGNNLCGCPEATGTCVGVTASLEPPQLLEPAPE